MEMLLFYLAILTLLTILAIGGYLAINGRTIQCLQEVQPLQGTTVPMVSIIIAARNEERHIELALQSVLHQDYANFETIVLNDRSCDRTGDILQRMAEQHPHLRIIHIAELPNGWLGKNHALQVGANAARGDFLLFTDGDVVMAPSTLARAMGFMLPQQLDHLAMAPDIHMPGPLLKIFIIYFMIAFNLYARPWRARVSSSRCHVGIGAFNLVRSQVYQTINGHQPLAMRPDDDMKLGKLIKQGGFRQDFLMGTGLISVEWYASVRELVKGLEKNSFAGLEYSLAALFAASLAQFLMFVWPLMGVLCTSGTTRLLNLAIMAVLTAIGCLTATSAGVAKRYAAGLSLGAALFIYTTWNATLKTLANDGIDWRGTHYSLAALKANRV